MPETFSLQTESLIEQSIDEAVRAITEQSPEKQEATELLTTFLRAFCRKESAGANL